jgi:hypothetical protein
MLTAVVSHRLRGRDVGPAIGGARGEGQGLDGSCPSAFPDTPVSQRTIHQHNHRPYALLNRHEMCTAFCPCRLAHLHAL